MTLGTPGRADAQRSHAPAQRPAAAVDVQQPTSAGAENSSAHRPLGTSSSPDIEGQVCVSNVFL